MNRGISINHCCQLFVPQVENEYSDWLIDDDLFDIRCPYVEFHLPPHENEHDVAKN